MLWLCSKKPRHRRTREPLVLKTAKYVSHRQIIYCFRGIDVSQYDRNVGFSTLAIFGKMFCRKVTFFLHVMMLLQKSCRHQRLTLPVHAPANHCYQTVSKALRNCFIYASLSVEEEPIISVCIVYYWNRSYITVNM